MAPRSPPLHLGVPHSVARNVSEYGPLALSERFRENGNVIRWLNLSLFLLFPVAWAAPLVETGLWPFLGGERISVLTGVATLWSEDKLLAILVALLAMVAPILKTGLLAGVHFGFVTAKALPALGWLSKLAMTDVFLVALYIVIAQGVGIGRVETAWGLYLFTACGLLSIFVTQATRPPWTKSSPS